jgi:carboxyl-terminal processing protease
MKRRVTPIRWFGFGLTVWLLMLGSIATGVVLDRWVLSAFVPLRGIPPDATYDFELMAEAVNVIERFYVNRDAVNPRELTYGALHGMVAALGDVGHSVFLSPDMVRAQKAFEAGETQGIGAEVHMREGNFVIVTPLDGSPAERAGLRPGEILLRVDGRSVTGLHLQEVLGLLSGSPGTPVDLVVLDPETRRIRDVHLVRAATRSQDVTWIRLPGSAVAHVRVASFRPGIAGQLGKALAEIGKQGMSGIILDLRNNPGGVVDESGLVVSEFLTRGNALFERDAKGGLRPIKVRPSEPVCDLKMAVLVNRGTASSAEIVAGALKDANRASLVGETTFGAGTVLNEFPLSDGSALLLAVKEWLTPGGRNIWHKGILPDIEVPLSAGTSPLFPEAEVKMNASQLQATEDEQLKRALSLFTQST